jgi:hypothetical protein
VQIDTHEAYEAAQPIATIRSNREPRAIGDLRLHRHLGEQRPGLACTALASESLAVLSSVTASQNGMPNSRKVEAAAAKPASRSCRSAELSLFGGSATWCRFSP